jgi:putative colanic acid biosynthesis acetyltransferase WcaF
MSASGGPETVIPVAPGPADAGRASGAPIASLGRRGASPADMLTGPRPGAIAGGQREPARETGMIDVMIISYNEALNLPHCLQALQGWTHNIFVIDSGSTDGTQEIARSMNAQVIHHAWEGYARQKNWGLRNLPLTADWVLIVDADEVITPKVREQLLRIAERPVDDVKENGFFINRLTIFLGQPIRHCGFFPSWNMRFFKRGVALYEDREVHEHMIVADPVGYIKEPMLHDDRRGLEHFIAKHNRYSTLEAKASFSEMSSPRASAAEVNITADARRRRWLKRNVAPYLPSPGLWRFFYMYILRLGILDGRAGLDFCRFISMYDYMVSLKLKDLRRLARRPASEVQARPSGALAVPEGGEAPPAAASSGASSPAWPAQKSRALPARPEPVQLRPESSPWTFREKAKRAVWMLLGKPIFRLSFHNWYGFRAWLLRLFGAEVGQGVRIRPTADVEIPWNLKIGDGVTVGDHAVLYSLGTITIGARTIISQYAHLCAGTHDFTDRRFPLIRDPIEIGSDAWISADAFVGPNVKVGRLSVLGARSSAYKDLEPQTVYVGNPAKALKKRELH